MNPNQLDQQAVSMAKAIRQTESGGDWNAKGKSGEYGAYQFTPATWDAYSREAGVNAAFGAATPDQQNEVAYKKIKQWKDQGYNVGQVASMWNAGVGKPNAYIEGHKGKNSLGVEYDTPAYAKKVAEAYQRLKGTEAPQPQVSPVNPTFLQDAGKSLGEVGTGLANAAGKAFAGEINPASGLLQGAGALAGGINDLTGDVLHHTPIVGDVVRGAEGLIGKGVEKVANTQAGQNIIGRYQDFAAEHPEAAGNIGAAGEIVAAYPTLRGLAVTKNALKGGVKTALKGATDDVLETVAKDLGPKGRAKAIVQRGTEKKGLLGKIDLKADPRELKIAESVRTHVPRFDPSAPLLNNVHETQTVVRRMAKELKENVKAQGSGRIYPKQELVAKLRNIEKPDLMVSDAVLDGAYNRLINRLESMLEKRPGRVDDLLDLRQEFDDIVSSQYPDLYASERLTPLRKAVGDIREEITDFTAKNLPEGAAFRESLWTQHRLLKAIENMAEKATKGPDKELGTTALERFGQRHPVMRGLVRAGGKAAVEGTGIGTVMRIMD